MVAEREATQVDKAAAFLSNDTGLLAESVKSTRRCLLPMSRDSWPSADYAH